MKRLPSAIALALLVALGPACGGGGGGGGGGPSFVVTTSGLLGATQGTAYSATLATSGGTAPYAWTVTAGALPAGLLINSSTGTISGTPTGTGLVLFTVTVTDNAMGSASRALTINVTTAGTQYDPPWGSIAPTLTVTLNYDGAKTGTQNGTILKNAMNALAPGNRLVVGVGTWVLNGFFNLTCTGTGAAPIVIEAASGATVVVQQLSGVENVMNVGSGSAVRYVTIRGIEWTGGSEGVRFYDCANVWFDRNHVHDMADAAVTANSVNTDHLYLTRNDIHSTGGSGEGMYLGGNNGVPVMHDSVIALNHVHDTNGPTVSQGDGIELKQGSYANLVAENLVHDCGYPCILVYGTGGAAQNVVERNTCYGSGDNVMQVQGEAIVRNNLLINGAGAAFASQVHQGSPTNLQVVHNTFINTGAAATLSSWSGAASMVFANNVCYSRFGNSVSISGGTAGVTFAGNVVFGPTVSVPGGCVPTANLGNPIADFTSVAWDGSLRNALPVAACTIIGAGNATYAVAVDITGATRVTLLESGAWDRP